MGTINQSPAENSKNQTTVLISKLVPYDQSNTEIFGPIKIYRKTQKPFSYILMYSQHGIDDPTTLKKMSEKLSWYKQLKPHPHISEIEGVQLVQKLQMCIKKVGLEIYAKYFNHTLEMAIQRKIKRNKRFKEADIFYVLNSLIDTWKHLNQFTNNKYLEIFTIKHVFLSPEGFIKMYPFPIDLDFISSPLKPKKTHSNNHSLLNNEEVLMDVSAKKTQSSIKISSPIKSRRQVTDKDNLKDIGIILLQLILLNKERQQLQQFSWQQQSQLLIHLQQLVSQQLREILLILLQKYRQATYQQLKQRINRYKEDLDRPISSNIKLEEGPEFFEPIQTEKNSNLRRLSEHQHLKTGIISIMSKKKKNQQQNH